MTTLKGVLIDPEAQSIRAIEVNSDAKGGYFADLYRLLDCTMVEHVYLGEYPSGMPWVVAIVDEEGLLTDKPLHFFRFKNGDQQTQPLAGKCVVLGLTEQKWDPVKEDEVGGEYMDSPVSVLDVHNAVEWMSPEEVRKFRDAGGFDSVFRALGPDMKPTGHEERTPLRPNIAGIDEAK